jgi:hypothetical protein
VDPDALLKASYQEKQGPEELKAACAHDSRTSIPQVLLACLVPFGWPWHCLSHRPPLKF